MPYFHAKTLGHGPVEEKRRHGRAHSKRYEFRVDSGPIRTMRGFVALSAPKDSLRTDEPWRFWSFPKHTSPLGMLPP
jgi:hypothetical protein